MDNALVVITLGSLATTGAVLFYAARLIRDERARSSARVTALAEEIGRSPGAGRVATPIERAPLDRAPLARGITPERGLHRQYVPVSSPVRSEPELRRPAPGSDALADAALFPARQPGTGEAIAPANARPGTLFESASVESPSNRWLVPVIGAMIVVLALATIYFVSGAPDGAAQPVRATAAVNAPLELVSLRQVRKGDTLTVSGTVRNPTGAADRRQVAAVVFVFDRNGSFVASGRAPLDYQALAPGDESPFVITVPGAADVSRYRVSFREGDDVLPHVDRREAAPAQQPAGAR